MRLSISNIAWDPTEDEQVAQLLQRFGLDAIDLAPGKYFADPASTDCPDVLRVRNSWLDRGIHIVGMQALLFGTKGLNLFGPPEAQERMLMHLAAVCRIGEGLGATRLTFGSPKNRDRTGLSDPEALEQAVSFFQRLGGIAARHGVTICLEPNPPRYGANFMVSARETAAVVEAVAHLSIRMQLDTGALLLTGEYVGEILETSAQLIGHVHASEPDLVPLGDGGVDHALIGRELASRLPDRIVAVEMLMTSSEPHVRSVERALRVAVQNYRPECENGQ